MPHRDTYNPARQHYWIAEGTGPFSSRFVRPACRFNDASLRRNVGAFTAHDTPSTDDPNAPRCADCTVIAAAAR